MDYVVGGVAALITGHATPDRPKLFKKALTPRKHEPSPNVTPKSEIDDRSIFLSPSVQRKKAIVKKSPKRIFQNPDLEETMGEDADALPSPKTEKVKKHLKNDLDVSVSNKISPQKLNGSAADVPDLKVKKNKSKKRKWTSADSSLVSDKENDEEIEGKDKVTSMSIVDNELSNTESVSLSGKKKKKKSKLNSEELTEMITAEGTTGNNESRQKKNKKQKSKQSQNENDENTDQQIEISTETKSKLKKNKQIAVTNENLDSAHESHSKKKNKKPKNKQNQLVTEVQEGVEIKTKIKRKKNKNKTLKTSIADKDSESEHESDDENLESDNERSNIEMLELPPAAGSSDEEEPEQEQLESAAKKKSEPRESDENETKRTLFVGNVPFSKKCKKEIKKIFGVYGKIETVRIRSVPVKDARFTQKVAAIKNELHPENSSVNVYVKFTDADSVEKALVENNRMVSDHQIRVTRSNEGGDWDPRKSVFVGNIPFKLCDDSLRQVFINCGDIHSVRIVRDKKTKAGKGFGYVNFMSKDGVELALGLSSDELTIDGRELRVQRCNTKGNKNRDNSATNRNNNPMNRNYTAMNRNNSAMNRNNNAMNRNNTTNRGGAPAFSTQPPKAFGAYARLMKKRQFEGDISNEPPNKRPRNIMQPHKEKKTRKEFVGVTATGKKKKQKFDKGQKKKKMLSQILTKN